MRQLRTAAVLVASCLALAACGSATVESEDTTESSAASATPTSSAESSPAEQTSEPPQSSEPAEAPAPAPEAEQPAREVESVPPPGSTYTAEEERFLDEIRNNGVNVEGVEDQITATGHSLCAGTDFTRDAVAGQLVEQRRTNLDPAALASLIEETAHAHLC
ncbi:hypothetical protein [Corynebacterium auris]|uniref:hypothetical protein n=1 Tax=Corynebacterium auris TaxID=44750 RepID=UPI0025B4A4D3|nr:hypothetical protein [Corynebacterium auris]WJY68967.1 hypothetical protein CAURIS_10480 [Corynebacterium auris]